MPDITLTDGSSLSVGASLFDNSVIGKTPNSVVHFVQADVLRAIDQPIDQVQISSTSLGLNMKPSFSLAGGSVKMDAGGGLSGKIDLYRPVTDTKPTVLFEGNRYGAEIDAAGNYYLALALQLGVNADAKAAPGAFTLKLDGSASGSAELYQPIIAQAGSLPTLKQALVETLSSYFLPSSLDDAARLKNGAGFVFESKGSIRFKGSVDVLAAVYPTATPGICKTFGPLTVNAGPSLTIGGDFSVNGDFQVRIWKKSDSLIQLGYYRKKGGSLALTFDASAGVEAEVGSFDVIAKLYGLLGDSGKLDPAWLKANVPEAVADNVEDAYEAAVQTSLSIALDGELDASVTDQAAFVWNIDLTKADAGTRAAFAQAIDGDLTALMNQALLPAGVTKDASVLDHLKDSKHTMTFNFLGLLDHAEVQDFVSRCVVKASEDGQLVVTDTEHLSRLDATATPLVKSDPLRQVFNEDCVATIGYTAALGPLSPQLKVSYTYYDFKDQGTTADLSDFLSIATQIGTTQAGADWAEVLESQAAGRPASFFASLLHDAATARGLFLDSHFAPRSTKDFESLARTAAAATPGLIGDDRFKAMLSDDAIWQQMCDAGSAPTFYQVIGDHSTAPSPAAVTFFPVVQHIQIWASDMNAAATALEGVVSYLTAHPQPGILQDAQFLQKRQQFASALQRAIQKTPLFQNAQGLITMYTAGSPRSQKVAIRYGSETREYS